MLTDRSAARAAGHRFYLAAKPCRAGHLAPRYVSTGGCTECLRSAREEDRQVARAAATAIYRGERLFAYRLHPDDVAAALAFCQGLDLQRGRTPATAPVAFTAPQAAGAPDLRPVEPNEIAQRRDELLRQHQPEARRQLPAEMERVLREHGMLPTNGS